MKKLLTTTTRTFTFRALMLMMIVVGLSSCADDDPYFSNSPIVGSWYLVDPPTAIYNEFDFYPDGSGNYYADDGYGTEYITWETWGSQLNVYFTTETWQFNWAMRGGYLYLYPYGDGSTLVYAPM